MTSQIALLIDTHVQDSDTIQLTSISNAISLTVFRLLHFLAAKSEKKGIEKISKQSHTSLKWGYKFFNSKSYVTRIEQHRLRDFKLKYFEEFENEVQRRLENRPQCLEVAVKKVKPSECLSKALTELLSDFPWERPDITSPVRRRKKKESITASNLVILFTRCPKSAVELKLFTGKQVPDSEVFLDSLLPPALYHQFCDVSRLALNWIDVGELYTETWVSPELGSVKIVQDALLKARGKLFPVSSVVQCGSPYFSNLATVGLAKDEESGEQLTDDPKSTFLLPFTTTLGSLLFNGKELCQSRKSDYTAILWTGENQSCKLVLRPPLKSCQPSNTVENKEISPSDVDLQTTDITETSASELGLFDKVKQPSFQLYAVLLQKDQFLLERKATFLCSESSGGGECGNTNTGLLEKMIEKVKKRNACLVLLCIETKQLAVLEALTVHTASLWFVPTGKQLWMEKQLFSQENVVSPPDTKQAQASCDSLIQRLVAGGHYKKCLGTEPLAEKSVSKFNPSLMDRWHIPGCSQNTVFSGLINKLNERITELDFLTDSEAVALRQLQKVYRQENKPPGLRDTSLVNMDESSHFNTTLDELSRLDNSNKACKNTSRQSVSRGELMYSLAKCKDGEKEREQREKDTGNVGGKKEKEKPEIAAQLCGNTRTTVQPVLSKRLKENQNVLALDRCLLNTEFKSPEELKAYLTSMYERVLAGEVTSIDCSVQTMVTVVNHYMKQKQPDSSEKSSSNLLEESVIVSGSRLREKYAKKSDEEDKLEKMIEYQFQVLLRLEMLSTLVNKDQTLGEEDSNDEIVGLLRTLSFISEPGMLSKFMETKILYNYVHSIPKTLANIYDELMQPLPDMLSNQLSPNTSGDHSDLNSSLIGPDDIVGPPSAHTRSHGSVGPPSSQPGSNRSVGRDMVTAATQKGGRKLVHHPSLADFGAKRQIVVQKIAKPKEKSFKKRKRKPSGKSEKDRISKRLFEGGRGGTKLERRQSVAVMERTHKTPKKSKSKYLLKSPRGLMSPRHKIVAETPCHKQVSQVLRRTPGKQKYQNEALEGAEVVEESPVKQVQGGLLQDTPTKAKRAKALLRRSFYSAGPVKRTRNLTKYFQLADKIAGRQRHISGNNSQPKLPKLISFEDPSEIKSPSKNSSFLLSQLMSSPSPRKRTPRKTLRSPIAGRRTPKRLGLHNPSPAKQFARQMALPSPSSAKKTPRKLGATPSKIVTESPSAHTRSKCDGNFLVPSADILLSPVSRRQSPRILAADSGTKIMKHSPDKTPVKSPVCGTVTTGLDSPSQNTRLRVATTPTRKSVRAALFAKSPVIKNLNTAIKRPELASMDKKIKPNSFSPDRQGVIVNLPCSLGNKYPASKNLSLMMSPQKKQQENNTERKSSEKFKPMSELDRKQWDNQKSVENPLKPVTPKEEKVRKCEKAVFEKCGSLNFGLNPSSKQGPTIIQRTPSPSKKQKTKTPDSFDKWHRRKPRSSQSSPAVRKGSQENTKASPEKTNTNCSLTTKNLNDSVISVNTNHNVTEATANEVERGPLRRIVSSQNKDLKFGRKRSLIPSPDKSLDSPSKRQRLSRLKSLGVTSNSSQLGSQGFEITGSFSEFSQNSVASSIDYLSASNDEVFLSQDNRLTEDVEMEDIENSQSANLDVRTMSQSSKGWFSPRHKTLNRITSSEFSPSKSHDKRSESPIFGSSKKSNCNRNISGENSQIEKGFESPRSQPQKSDRESPARNSPSLGKSPANKKYSPVVSAKSLMHLIQSPLLTSPKDDNKSVQATSSPTARKIAVGDRSRRSLKLQNY